MLPACSEDAADDVKHKGKKYADKAEDKAEDLGDKAQDKWGEAKHEGKKYANKAEDEADDWGDKAKGQAKDTKRDAERSASLKALHLTHIHLAPSHLPITPPHPTLPLCSLFPRHMSQCRQHA